MAHAACPAAGRMPRTGRTAASAWSLAVGLALVLSGCAGSTSSAEDREKLLLAEAQAHAQARAAVEAEDAESSAAASAENPEPLVTATPDEHSQVGDLVEGFPIELLPVPSDAVILVTSAVPVGNADIQQVSLNLRTQAQASQLLTLYRDALTEAGFTEVPAVAGQTNLAAEATFTRSGGDELITIGVLDVDDGRTVSIGGRVHTGK